MLIDHHSLLKEPQGTLFGSQDFSKAHPIYLKTTSNSIIYIYIYIYKLPKTHNSQLKHKS